MEGFEQLSLIAEIAATFAGFIAIFIAFSRDDGRFSDGDKHFIQAIVLNSAFVIVFALAPQAFSKLFDLESVWKINGWCALAVGAIIAIYIAIQQLQMDEDEACKVFEQIVSGI